MIDLSDEVTPNIVGFIQIPEVSCENGTEIMSAEHTPDSRKFKQVNTIDFNKQIDGASLFESTVSLQKDKQEIEDAKNNLKQMQHLKDKIKKAKNIQMLYNQMLKSQLLKSDKKAGIKEMSEAIMLKTEEIAVYIAEMSRLLHGDSVERQRKQPKEKKLGT